MTKTRDEQVIFAFTPGCDEPDGIPSLVFIMPEAAWSYMRNGMGHEFDLTNVGIPLRIVIGRTKDHETGMKLVEQANTMKAANVKDVRHVDVHFGSKPKQ
jgi:hypothetical protein